MSLDSRCDALGVFYNILPGNIGVSHSRKFCARARDVAGAPPMRAMSCNAHRASESALGGSTIADELSEAIVLSNVHCLVGEWVPFGSNQARPTPDASQHARKSSITHVAE